MSFTLWEQSELADYAANAELDIMGLTRQLVAANARIAELEDAAQERIAELEAELVSLKHKLIALESAKPATIHEVIDDYGDGVTAVTL